MRTSESVLYDSEREQLYVACINEGPWVKDGNGFIALLDLDGNIKSEKWVTGLDAPKGMGIYDGMLYVTNIDEIVVIDIKKAEIHERIPIPGAEALNDISIDKNGKVYFSDSGTGWIWTMTDGKPEQWIGNFERPNGLYVEEERVLLASVNSSDLKVINLEEGTFVTIVKEIGAGDGVEYTGMEGYYLVSSWRGELFLVTPDLNKISLLNTSDQGKNTADIGFNIEEQIVYVPTFFDNRVVAYKLVKSDA
jgi:sugar lactone lactonase YvrE